MIAVHSPSKNFEEVCAEISGISLKLHQEKLLAHAEQNRQYSIKSIKDLPLNIDGVCRSALVISAGPSLRKKNSIKKIKSSSFDGLIIAVDASLIACLKEGLIPDYVLTLDSHETRIVRWFGDPDIELNSRNDDYFQRQDLDIDFRHNLIKSNKINIELINQYAPKIKAIVSSSSPKNVVSRLLAANFDTYWWNPLVDDPTTDTSLTKKLININKLPCLNTGGNVGTAAWCFATSFLKAPRIGMVGMDFGYYSDLPYSMTQKYYELIEYLGSADSLDKHFLSYTFPFNGEKFYTDATYQWYRNNFLELLPLSNSITLNCTEGGTLYSDRLQCVSLESFLENESLK
jgi:hypothetical protein